MNKFAILFTLGCLVGSMALGQKFGYVDTQYILSQMPEYKEAQQRIDELSAAWMDEIQEKYQEVERLYTELQAEKVLLTKDMFDERYAEIQSMEDELKEYQNQVFGFEGQFFLKKKELIKPVQDKVFEAVEKVAKSLRLAIIFDKSSDLVMIYTDPIHDYTEYVLEELGLKDENDLIND
ncbi:MAG TPA: outer membrane chaperone Skp [Cytophagales bacterium]|nr:outer membrane chaperone Skp [Cytophagales bacterium]HAA23408.1 outer membrane chaperone Skp [Cytophagales bacterium]HAP58111.1 outer membrane chaperone Skp [Cytophagales bacterium]